MNLDHLLRNALPLVLSLASLALLASCSSAPPLPPPPPPAPPSQPTAPPPPVVAPSPPRLTPPEPAAPAAKISSAANPRDYRRDAARHLYESLPQRILAGKLPPLLYAIGVLEVELDGNGHVSNTHWLRKPSHAPEVVAEIEQFVRRAAPFPKPVRLGRVTYTDTWLWDKSGRFQLDTLTEGQL